jgi:hypothetical protein
MILLDLNHNDAEALLRHCQQFRPASNDNREDRRLQSAIEELAEAIKMHLSQPSRRFSQREKRCSQPLSIGVPKKWAFLKSRYVIENTQSPLSTFLPNSLLLF